MSIPNLLFMTRQGSCHPEEALNTLPEKYPQRNEEGNSSAQTPFPALRRAKRRKSAVLRSLFQLQWRFLEILPPMDRRNPLAIRVCAVPTWLPPGSRERRPKSAPRQGRMYRSPPSTVILSDTVCARAFHALGGGETPRAGGAAGQRAWRRCCNRRRRCFHRLRRSAR